ncbi:MAG: glycosyltransferase family 2 protein [Pseudomonadota bacterium]
MVENHPLVSVIMPAYNAELYINDAIQSVINQTYDNWELIIINDGSTDNTLEAIQLFFDERIVLLEQENKGVSAARNVGLDVAKGKFITFLDADDILPEESLISRVNYLNENSDIDLVDGIVVTKTNNMKKVINVYKPYYLGKLLPKLMKLDSRVFFGICYLFNKRILNDTRFNEDMSHAEDLLFYIEISSKKAVNYGFVSKTIYCYRKGHISAMVNLTSLEKGYASLIKNIACLNSITFKNLFFLRMKIMKIMFLSWLSQNKLINAILTFRFLWLS